MNWWPFQNTKRRRPRQNTRFRHRSSDRDSKLAVKVPRSRKEMRQAREQRVRKLLIWCGIGAVVIGAGFWAKAQWQRVFHANPEFAVGEFEYKTNGGIKLKEALSAAGLRPDMNLMDADLAGVREKLLSLPRVKTVKVERRLPARLAIEIEERLPVARLTSPAKLGQGIFIDSSGIVIKCDERREYNALPTINDTELSVVTFGARVDSRATLAALELLEKFRSRHLPAHSLVNVIYAPNSWTLNLETDTGSVFQFNTSGIDAQLDRLAFILAKTSERGISVASVNLQMQRNVPVVYDQRIAEAPPAPPAPGTATPLEAIKPRTQRVSAPAGTPARSAPASSREKRDIGIITRGGA